MFNHRNIALELCYADVNSINNLATEHIQSGFSLNLNLRYDNSHLGTYQVLIHFDNKCFDEISVKKDDIRGPMKN